MGNYIYTVDASYKKYGWKPDLPDHRDHKIFFTETLTSSDNIIDLRDNCPPVYDQGHLGSCTANAISFLLEFDQMKQKEEKPFIPSRLFIYFNEREMEGTITIDSGASIRDGIHSVYKIGYVPETDWPYDTTMFTVKPYQELYEKAKHHRSIKYKRVKQTEKQLKMALKSGYPICCGISVYESFESLTAFNTGMINMPTQSEKLLGGHAIALVGFDDSKRDFIFRNSWANKWGDNGYGFIPYDYILNPQLSSDFWIIERVLDE